jgi:hypothetical protein
LTTCSVIGVAGMAAVYQDTSLVRIEEFSRLYERAGLGDEVMITAFLALPLGIAIAGAAMILLRTPRDPAAILMAVGMTSVYFFTSGAASGVQNTLIRHASASASIVLIMVFLTVFPSGRYEPRWSMVAPVLAAGIVSVNPTIAIETRSMLSDATFASSPSLFRTWTAWTLLLIIAAAAQIERYRTRSTDRQRSQSRLVVLGAFGLLIPPVALLVLNAAGMSSAALTASMVVASIVGSTVFPMVVLIAVFRHHLYDIDRIISRTVTYSLVAMVVALSYVVSVLVIPPIVGGSNDFVIAVSTLVAAAVFDPARRRIQRRVDRRFDRARYDAVREVTALTERLASETDLETVSDELIDVIGRTLAPCSASIWVREES